MTKAGEITPGMVIGWMDSDVYTRMTVARYDLPHHAVWSESGIVRSLKPNTEVEVIFTPPAIPEPKVLGARVKAGDRLFLLTYDEESGWVDVSKDSSGDAYTWVMVTSFGPVTVIEGDPSWEVETDEDEQWSDLKEALGHCDKVVDKRGDTWHYVDGVLYLTMRSRTAKWPLNASSANGYGPFRRA